MMNKSLSALPAVGDVLAHADHLVQAYGHRLTVDAIRHTIHEARTAIRAGNPQPDTSAPALITAAAAYLQQTTTRTLRPVINATGVIIHTNLGRAPLSSAAIRAMTEAAGYSSVEFDLQNGKRGSRHDHPVRLLQTLTGADDALVVNNAASALVLVLAALTAGREVLVSRGQAVEIGGGFRIPEIIAQSGSHLVEVGTTNKTRASDYAAAITPLTAALLRVHASNFRLVGFTESTPLHAMAGIAQAHDLLLIDDVGSGALLDPAQFGLAAEPLVRDSITAGADLTLFSGDKLLGGPQSGIIVGTQAAITQLRQHPLARALRPDKTTLAALVATLEHYQRGEALTEVPVWWMMGRVLCDLGRIAKRWAKQFPNADIQKGESTVGGGSVPGTTLPTVLLALDVQHPDAFLQRLRHNTPPVIGRIADDRVLLDPRTVFPQQENTLLTAIGAALQEDTPR